jgi:hypothetical protein
MAKVARSKRRSGGDRNCGAGVSPAAAFGANVSRVQKRQARRLHHNARRSLYERSLLRLEWLETRRLLAIDMVTSNLDDGSTGTLRSVIAGAAAGDTIEFQSSISRIDLTQAQIVPRRSSYVSTVPSHARWG